MTEIVDIACVTPGDVVTRNEVEFLHDIQSLRAKLNAASSFYVYVLYKPDLTPFYVGKGTGSRILNHESDARNTSLRSHKLNVIRAIHRAGRFVVYRLDAFFDQEKDALARERELITEIGRHDLGRGPLTNQTDGGEGTSNPSIESRERRATTLGGLSEDPDRRAANQFFASISGQQHSVPIKPLGARRLEITTPAGPHRIWTPGRYFVQNHLYWAYLILILTGMRPGEVGQIKCVDIKTDGEYYYFDLRPFDARKGRVAIEDLRNLKTNSSGRVVPIHPLLIELGLLDRMLYLMKAGEERLFPEWKEYSRGDGTTRWSQPITKSWQYVKTVLKIVRADLTLYATRHLMADWLDNSTIAKRTRDRILGHVTDVPGGYGRKGSINADQMAAISALEPEIVKQMREILVAAKDRAESAELIVLKPQSKKRAGVAKRSE